MLGNFPDVKVHIFGISMLCVDALDVLQFRDVPFHIFGIVCLQLCLFDSCYTRQYFTFLVLYAFLFACPLALFIPWMNDACLRDSPSCLLLYTIISLSPSLITSYKVLQHIVYGRHIHQVKAQPLNQEMTGNFGKCW